MAYNPNANIVISGKTFTDVPSVQFKTPDGAMVNFAHVGGSIRFSPTLEEQTNNVENFSNAIIDPITSTLLNQLDSDFVAENIKKDINLFGLLGTLEASGGNTMFGRKFEYGSITPADDIAEDYVINFQEGFSHDVLTPPYYNFVLWCENTDAGGTDTPNSSWMWLIMGRRGQRAGFSYGQYHSASGSVSNASYAGVIGESNYSSRVKIYCTSSKKLIAGRTYNWIAVSN